LQKPAPFVRQAKVDVVGLLMFLLCLLTMFFLFLQGLEAFRKRKSKATPADHAVDEENLLL